MKIFRRLYYILDCYLAWAMFFFVGLLLNMVCAPMLLLPRRPQRGAAVRKTIHRLFSAWCGWLHASRLIYVSWHGFTPEALKGPAVYVANHPGLLDATFILARLPDTICIFKPALIRNPAMGPAAIMAEYASGESGIDVIRDVAGRVAAGRSLLIFPEGTRTAAGVALNPLKPGFALIAARARAPVRLISVRAPRDLVPKGAPWWRVAAFPAYVEITLLGEVSASDAANATELTARVAQQLSAALAAS